MDNARQQIVDSIKSSSNILVTVSSNPSVDELSASLGLAIILNSMDKRATAIFSGDVPPAIHFLEPEKTFENTADSLRDFIIALNKEKADHLRYKVEGEHVKIFITPYRTTLSQADLEFSQGDYNVELVIALGVKDQEHLDKAIEAHGKILHDAKVVTVTAGTDASSLGSLDWRDEKASSLSEMIVGLADGLKGNQAVVDNQIATALLTGIVSATDRFSNDRTSSRTMTVAAQLMAAGANQQLIAAKLEEAHDIAPGPVANNDEAVSTGEKDESGTKLTIERSKNTEKSIKESPSELKPEPFVATESEVQQVVAEPDDEAAQQDFEKRLNDLAVPVTRTLSDIENELKIAAEKSSEAPDTLTSTSDVMMPGFETSQPDVPSGAAAESEPEVVPDVSPADSVDSSTPAIEEKASDELPLPEEPVLPVEETATLPGIINDHGQMAPQFDTSPAINSIQSNPNEGESPTVDPFAGSTETATETEPGVTSMKVEPALAAPDTTIGTPEGAALLASDPEKPVWEPKIAIPQLPPLPPLPSDAGLPPLPPPPPPPPTFQPGGAIPPGAVSGDIFGDGSTASQNPNPPTTSPPEPGQFRIPGSPS